jgi:hypothetical protein
MFSFYSREISSYNASIGDIPDAIKLRNKERDFAKHEIP